MKKDLVRYRRFCLLCFILLSGMLVYNALVWHFATRDLLTRDEGYYTGDLARMGYHSDIIQKRQTTFDLPRRHTNLSDYRGGRIDMLVVGDSFAQIGGNGRNPFFQDYIATVNEMNVVNVGYWPDSSTLIDTILVLINSGLLDQLKPRYLMLETIARNCYEYAGPIDFVKSASLEEVRSFYGLDGGDPEGKKVLDALPEVSFLNSGNYKWLLYKVLYNFSPNAFNAKVYRARLDRDLFSGSNENTLLFFDRDLRNLKEVNPDVVEKMNQNLNRLASMLREKGVEFIFLPPPDKYDLYHPYIIGEHYPENPFFELLRPLHKEYQFIDAKQILAQELERGIRDVYFIDDTHWSWKASQALFKVPLWTD